MKYFSSILLVTLFVGALAQAAATDDLCFDKSEVKEKQANSVTKRSFNLEKRIRKVQSKSNQAAKKIEVNTKLRDELVASIEGGFCDPTQIQLDSIATSETIIQNFKPTLIANKSELEKVAGVLDGQEEVLENLRKEIKAARIELKKAE